MPDLAQVRPEHQGSSSRKRFVYHSAHLARQFVRGEMDMCVTETFFLRDDQILRKTLTCAGYLRELICKEISFSRPERHFL